MHPAGKGGDYYSCVETIVWVRSALASTDASALRAFVEGELGKSLVVAALEWREVPSGMAIEYVTPDRAYVWFLRRGPSVAFLLRISGAVSDLPAMRVIAESLEIR